MAVAKTQDAPLRLFIPLTKIDIEKRLVYGVATAEEPDRAGEICDYASTKPFFQSWSSEISKSTGGKSLGNVRAMHGNVAAGKLTAISFDDEARKIEVCAKVVDNDEWAKVKEGVYTGFSQGGRYVKRWEDEDTGLTRYTAEPMEVSLVDLPCLPSATFSVIKAGPDGRPEALVKTFRSTVAEPTVAEVMKRAETLAKKAGRAEGEVKDEDLDLSRKQLLAEALRKADPNSTAAIVAETGSEMSEIKETLGEGPSDVDISAEAERIAAAEGIEVDDDVRAKAKSNLSTKAPVEGIGPEAMDLKVPTNDYAGANPMVAEDIFPGKAAGAGDDEDLVQVWVCGCDDHRHLTKSDAKKCRRARKATLKAEEVTASIDAAFKAIEAGLGVEKRAYSAEDSRRMASSGEALPDGSYPIADKVDLHNAIEAFGRAKDKGKAKSHIRARAKALGAESMLPDDWKKTAAAEFFKASATAEQKAVFHSYVAAWMMRARGEPAEKADARTAALLSNTEAALSWSGDIEDAAEKASDALDLINSYFGKNAEAFYLEVDELVGESIRNVDATKALRADLAKYLGEEAWDAQTAIGCLTTLYNLLSGEIYEVENQPDQIKALSDAISRIKDFIASEIQERDDPSMALAMAVSSLELAKRGARNSNADQARMQKCHDLLKEMGAECMSKMASGVEKSAQDEIDRLETEVAELKAEKTTYLEKMASYGPRLEEIQTTVEKFARAPAPAKAALFAVERSSSAAASGQEPALTQKQVEDALNSMTPDQRAMALTKAALANPTPLYPQRRV